jgi:hypothetical protein
MADIQLKILRGRYKTSSMKALPTESAGIDPRDNVDSMRPVI